ncbi:hypothetical protein [Rhodococcus qingshengii]|uniref:Uncharacterized protein n=1 Tax=Rhodococcus qingshengii JCM 15477 TaxID=1303681 RepID=A0AB38RQJ8_RHOSG|nr:hypothetical protein [Rhodococcus qingshengii]UPU47024.1 hypothetical protein M0639_33640 [Rhodococcus qingshengii JCM 15477]
MPWSHYRTRALKINQLLAKSVAQQHFSSQLNDHVSSTQMLRVSNADRQKSVLVRPRLKRCTRLPLAMPAAATVTHEAEHREGLLELLRLYISSQAGTSQNWHEPAI